MLKNKSRGILSVVLASSLVVSGLTAAAPALAAETAAAVTASSKFSITANAEITAQLQAFNDLKALFTATPDLAGIKAQYIAQLQAAVKVIDPSIDGSITSVLDLAVEGKLNAGQAKQAVDKGLQWYFYATIKDLLNNKAKAALEKGDTAAAKAELDKAIQVYEGALQATAVKRDTKFGTQIQDLIDLVVIPAIQEDVAKGDLLSYHLHRQMFDKSLIKVFLLATLTYAEGIPAKPETDRPAAFTEGYFFFQPIYGSLKGGSAEDADYVLNAFASGDVSLMDPASVNAALFRAVEGKISGYVNKTLASMEKQDLTAAQITAMEGNMFLASLETMIVSSLGKDVYDAAIAAGQSYFEAVAAGNYEEAEARSFEVLQTVSKVDGISMKIGEQALSVNGSDLEMDTAPYIHPETSRTLVPARFIAEGLGATVDFAEATRTVIIMKHDVKIELAVGSDTVIQNGKAIESLKLDQPVLINQDGRSFIPLRAIAELFGNKVFYSNGEIVIVK